MIEPLDDEGLDDCGDLVEIDDHALRGSAVAERSGERDFEAVRVPVESRALAGMVRQHVGCLEAKMFADLHERARFVKRPEAAYGLDFCGVRDS